MAIMKITDAIQMQHLFQENQIYLIAQGSFYHVYNEGAQHLQSITGYKVRPSKYGTVLGFPLNVFPKVLGKVMDNYPGHVIGVEPLGNTHIVIKIDKD